MADKVAAVALALTAAAVLLAVSMRTAVHAQSIMRSPSFNIGPRITRISPNITGDAGRSEQSPAALSDAAWRTGPPA